MSSRPAHEAKQKVQDLIHQTVITRGLKSAGMFGAGGVGVHFALTYAFPRYARHSLPWKVFAMMMVPTAAFFTSTDIAAKELVINKIDQRTENSRNSFQLPQS